MNDNAQRPNPAKLMTRMIIISAIIIIVIGTIYYRSFVAVPFTLGVCVTSALNVLKIWMLERSVQRIAGMDVEDKDMGKNIVRFQYLLRYFLTGVVLVAIGLIQNYTSPPPINSNRTVHIEVWATLFPNGPESLLNAPFISIWGALAGIFTLQLAVLIVRSMKLEKDGENFIKYEDDTESENDDDGESSNDNENEGIVEKNVDRNVENDENGVENDVDY